MSASEKSSRSTSFVDHTGNVVVLASDLSNNRTAYKYDTECTICDTAAWTIFNQKKYCKFCYRCVCKDCSPHQVFHPEREKLDRCCNACFSRFISQGVIEDFQREIEVKDGIVKHANSLLQEEKDRRMIQGTTLTNLKEDIARLSEEIAREGEEAKQALREQEEEIFKLENDLSTLLAELPVKREELSKAKVRLTKSKAKLEEASMEAERQREELDNSKNRLSTLQDEFAHLQRMVEDQKMCSSPDLQKSRISRKGKAADLQTISDGLKAQVESLQQDNEELEKQIQQFRAVKPPPDTPDREMEKLSVLTKNPLLGQYGELQSEVERLRRELENSPAPSSAELLETEVARLRRNLLKVQEENEDLVAQMERYRQHTAGRRHTRKCVIW